MPELPEVESIKKIVSPVFIGQKLIKYSVNDERTNRFNTANPRNLGVLLDVSRKGKVLDFTFNDYSIFFHLGMSGRIDINSKTNKHTRAEFIFNKDCLFFDDIRKFGYIKFTSNQLKDELLQLIGPDILELSIENKRNILKKGQNSKVTIKNFLLNQKNMSGLGNIYVNEVLKLIDKKRILIPFPLPLAEFTARLFESVGVEVGPDLNNMERVPFRTSANPMDQGIPPFTGDKEVEFRGDYDTDGFIWALIGPFIYQFGLH